MGKKSLKIALIGILLIFAIVPGLVVGTVATFSMTKYSSDVKMEQLKSVSLSKSSALDIQMSNYVADVSTLSMLDAVVQNARDNNGAAWNQLKSFCESNDDILDTLIIDDKGSVLISVANVEKDAFEHFDENGMATVSGLLTWEKYKTDAVYVSMPIFADPEKREGGKLGYVIMVIDVDNLECGIGKIIKGDYLDGNAHLFLLDSEGNAINYDGSGSVMKSGQLDSSIVSQKDAIFDKTQGINGSNDESSMIQDKFGRYNVVYGFIPNISTWRWVGIADSSVFSSFASKNILIVWVIIAIVAVIGCIGAVIIIGKFVKDMHEMLKKMESLNVDDLDSAQHFDVKNNKSELGSIQNSFNEFMDEVNVNGQRYRILADLSDNMLFEWDFHKERMYISDNTLEKFNLNPQEATLSNGRFLDSLMEDEDKEKYKRDINKLLKERDKLTTVEYQLKSKTGAMVWVSMSAAFISDRLGEPLRVIGVMTDIDNEKKMELQLSERASYDFLSQLYNRDTFLRMLSSELDRRGPKKIGIMFIDVDDFKFINDRFGHTIGDEVIRFVSDTIRKKVDDRGGFAGRFGGDEFVLCYTDQEDIANAEQIAMDLIDELYVGYTTSDGGLINVRVSIGISYCPDHSETVDDLISCADTAMYFVKKNGKTNYHVYVTEDSTSGEYVNPERY